LAVVEQAASFGPPHGLKTVEIPEPNRANFSRPRRTAGKMELGAQVVRQIKSVMDDVSLMDREDGVAREMGLVRHHPMTEDWYQLRRGGDQIARHPFGVGA
jgi:hypothetical protein